MPWYAVTWMDRQGDAIKREILHRDGDLKLWKFIESRVHINRIPERAIGVAFIETSWEELQEESYIELRPSSHAVEVPTKEEYFDDRAKLVAEFLQHWEDVREQLKA